MEQHSDNAWVVSPGERELAQNVVHIWRASLDQPDEVIAHLQHNLSPEELARVKRFCFEKDRRHWIVARGLLRHLLGQYLDIEPAHIVFRYNAHGKPFVEHPITGRTLQFNLSHSADLAVYAFIHFRPLGIDVQYTRRKPKVDCEKMARYQFSQYEYEALHTLPKEEREAAFYRCWARKEAYLKARGSGMSIALDQFDVAFLPGESPALLASRENPDEVTYWSFQEVPFKHDFVGALVVEGPGWHSQYREWQPQ